MEEIKASSTTSVHRVITLTVIPELIVRTTPGTNAFFMFSIGLFWDNAALKSLPPISPIMNSELPKNVRSGNPRIDDC